MRLAPVSGDLLVKLALAGLAAGVAVWAVRRASGAAAAAGAAAWETAAAAAWSVSPLNQENVIYQTANQAVSTVLGREETLGGWLYDVTHPDPVKSPTIYEPTGVGPGVTVTDGQTFNWGY